MQRLRLALHWRWVVVARTVRPLRPSTSPSARVQDGANCRGHRGANPTFEAVPWSTPAGRRGHLGTTCRFEIGQYVGAGRMCQSACARKRGCVPATAIRSARTLIQCSCIYWTSAQRRSPRGLLLLDVQLERCPARGRGSTRRRIRKPAGLTAGGVAAGAGSGTEDAWFAALLAPQTISAHPGTLGQAGGIRGGKRVQLLDAHEGNRRWSPSHGGSKRSEIHSCRSAEHDAGTPGRIERIHLGE